MLGARDAPPNLSRVRAFVFDVDGTLYDDRAVRLVMFRRLMTHCLRCPADGARTVRVLRAYRHAQERLRHGPQRFDTDIAATQLAAAATAAAVPSQYASDCVRRWMEESPLSALLRARRDGLVGLLSSIRRRGLRTAAASDYPAEAKLASLQVGDYFDAIVCAQHADVQRFKPDPRALLIALGRLGVAAGDALYVADRPDIDPVAAERAGMRCVIVGSRSFPAGGPPFSRCTFRALADALEQEAP